MKTSISLCSVAAAALALAVFTGCDETRPGGASSQVSRHNYALGRYHATTEQTRIARQRARSYYAKMSSAKKKTMDESGVRYLAVRTLDPSPEQLVEIEKRRTAGGGGSFGYGGASVSGASPQAASKGAPLRCVMIWDTHVKDVVGSDCYAVTAVPPQGATVRFDTYAAEYVGAGVD